MSAPPGCPPACTTGSAGSAVDYQDAAAERGIVALRTQVTGPLGARLMDDAVAVTRATRQHPEIRQGSSVRGAIDLVLVAEQLASCGGRGPRLDAYPPMVYDAMVVALSGRIHLDEAIDATPEQVLREIWEDHFILQPGHRRARLKSGRGASRRPAGPRPTAPGTRPGRCGGSPNNSTRSPPVFEPAAGGKGAVWRAQPGRAGATAAGSPRGTAQGFTDERRRARARRRRSRRRRVGAAACPADRGTPRRRAAPTRRCPRAAASAT